MRLVSVKGPEGSGDDIAKLAFASGIEQVAHRRARVLRADQTAFTQDVIDVETSTARAKEFIDRVMAASFFDPENFSIVVRQPRAIIGKLAASELTKPLVEPVVDLWQELWQFSHVTYGFVGRILIGALLLAYGIIQYNLLFMIAGLLFIPLLPVMLAIAFGICTKQWRLLFQGLIALVTAATLLLAGGAIVALLTSAPIAYNESNSLVTGFLISLAVGVAAALTTIDDVGRREMIGLAATAQVAVIPVWFGAALVFGFPPLLYPSPKVRLLSWLANVGAIVLSSGITYVVTGMRASTLSPMNDQGNENRSSLKLPGKPAGESRRFSRAES